MNPIQRHRTPLVWRPRAILGLLALLIWAGCSESATDPVVQEKVRSKRMERLELGKSKAKAPQGSPKR